MAIIIHTQLIASIAVHNEIMWFENDIESKHIKEKMVFNSKIERNWFDKCTYGNKLCKSYEWGYPS